MRILKVVQSYFPFQDRGGPVVKVRALARGLARRGHQVTVLTADLGWAGHNGSGKAAVISTEAAGGAGNVAGVRAERCRWGWRAEEDGVEATYLRTIGHYRALTVNPSVLAFCSASLEGFDLVHFYGLYDLLGPAVSYFCQQRKIPYLVEPMGMYFPIDRSFRLKYLWHRTIGKSYLRNAMRMVATSEMEKKELLQAGISPASIILRYNGIDPDSFADQVARGEFRARYGISAEEPLVLFLGRLIPRKGADVLIESFAEVCGGSGRLVIAGPEGERGYSARLEKQAEACGVASRVIFTGPLYGSEKQSVFADADVFVLPSRYENFANSAAEAIAGDIPVIITEACGIRSLVEGRAGLVISPGKESLTQALRTILSNRPLYLQLKAGCREVAAQLSWDRLTEQMEGYYFEVLGRGA
jgi:glycosyltransferase involved in cell wall biosynthesis